MPRHRPGCLQMLRFSKCLYIRISFATCTWSNRWSNDSVFSFKISGGKLKMAAFWDIAPCSLFEVDRRLDVRTSTPPDYGGSTHHWNVGLLKRNYAVPYPRKLPFSCSPPWEPEIPYSDKSLYKAPKWLLYYVVCMVHDPLCTAACSLYTEPVPITTYVRNSHIPFATSWRSLLPSNTLKGGFEIDSCHQELTISQYIIETSLFKITKFKVCRLNTQHSAITPTQNFTQWHILSSSPGMFSCSCAGMPLGHTRTYWLLQEN
jgi:hypothetical protein